MTMFKRVFSNHLEAQDEDKPDLAYVPPREDIAPVPPPPPEWTPHEKSQMAEMPQTAHLDAALFGGDEDDSDAADGGDPALAARAAEIHAQMMSRAKPTPMVVEEVKEAEAEPEEPRLTPVRRRGSRARTRLLGFDPGGETTGDPIAQAQAGATASQQTHPTGWIVITDGPGRGQSFAVHNGVAMVGRGEDQAIRLDFGDQAISRQNHAALAYDSDDNKHYLGHGGKSNIIKLNGRPVLSTEELNSGDIIRIGETTLRFVALCGPDFQWGGDGNE